MSAKTHINLKTLFLASSLGLASMGIICAIPAAAQPTYNAPLYDDYAQPVTVHVGQSLLLPLAGTVTRIAVADNNVIDYRQTGSNQLYLLGRQVGKTDLTIWYASGSVRRLKIEGALDPVPLQQLINSVTNQNSLIDIRVSGSSFILQGQAADMPTVDTVLRVSAAYAANLSRQLGNLSSGGGGQNSGGGGASAAPATSAQGSTAATLVSLVNQTALPGSNRDLASSGVVGVINSLSVQDSQQVMLEVRIAEVSRTVSERLGVSVGANNASNSNNWRVGSALLGTGAGTASFTLLGNGPNVSINLDAEEKAGRVKILAEPNIAAMSGTEGSFLVGGSVFIPMPSASSAGNNGSNVTLEERDFGVSLKFRPVVLADRNINLDISAEVSELSREGISYQSGQSLAILPTLTKSKVATTVQLLEGQSLIIGGLLKNSATETNRYIPILSQIPILGALFQSKDYSSGRSELIVVVRPVFAKATDATPEMPADFGPPLSDSDEAATSLPVENSPTPPDGEETSGSPSPQSK